MELLSVKDVAALKGCSERYIKRLALEQELKAQQGVNVLEDGRSAATVNWPVTAGEKQGWNMPEIWPVGNKSSEEVHTLFAGAASDNVMDAYYKKYIRCYNWQNNEDSVGYAVEIALDIVRNHQPDVVLCHVTHLDHIRHVYGVQNREVDDCLRQLDIIAGRFLQATKEAGTFEDTNFVILGDHGQLGIEKIFHLNMLFRESGLITVGDSGVVSDYDVYSFSAGFSAHIILKDPDNMEILNRVKILLKQIAEQYPQYIETVYSAEEVMEKEHLAGEFAFVVEAKTGVLFDNDIQEVVLAPEQCERYRNFVAMHGYHPDKGEKPPFVAFGPDISPRIVIEHGEMIDIAPTLAALAGVTLSDVSGKPFPFILPMYQH